MNLKPMDENTKAFLKELVSQHEQTIQIMENEGSQYLDTWFDVERDYLRIARRIFTTDEKVCTLEAFMEAIKNA